MSASFSQWERRSPSRCACDPAPLTIMLLSMEALSVSVTASDLWRGWIPDRDPGRPSGFAGPLSASVNHLARPENGCWSLIPKSGCLARTSRLHAYCSYSLKSAARKFAITSHVTNAVFRSSLTVLCGFLCNWFGNSSV